MKPTTGRLSAVVLAALVAWPAVAEAHSPIKGLGTFYNSMLHPLAVPAHAMVLIAVALLLGQQRRNAAGHGLITFALGFAIGLVLSGAGLFAGVREPVMLAGCLVIGGAVSLGRRPPIVVLLGLAGSVGVLMGLDSTPETTTAGEAMLAYAGLTTGVLYLATVVSGLTINPVLTWQRVGVRVAGSWIVAASVLVLALSIASPAKDEAPVSNLEPRKARPC